MASFFLLATFCVSLWPPLTLHSFAFVPPTSRHFKTQSWQVIDFPEVSRRKQHNAPPPQLNKTDETPAGVGTCCCNSVGDLYHFSKHLSDSPLSIAHWLRLQSTFLVSLMAKALLRLGVNNRLSVDGDLLEAQQQFHVCYLFLRELWWMDGRYETHLTFIPCLGLFVKEV